MTKYKIKLGFFKGAFMFPIGIVYIVIAVSMFQNSIAKHPLSLLFETFGAIVLLIFGVVFLLSGILGMIEWVKP